MIVFLSVKFSVTTVSDVFIYLKVVWAIASVDSATASNELLSDSSLAPYEQEINNISKGKFSTQGTGWGNVSLEFVEMYQVEKKARDQ